MDDGQSRIIFVDELRRVLQNLYDPAALRKSPLLALFILETRPNPISSLREVILNAILALKPSREIPIQSNAWRIFHVLTYRYVEQTQQPLVAANMALSVRQLRRLERDAEQMLADHLWKQCHLDPQAVAELPVVLNSPRDETSAENTAGADENNAPDRDEELEWLRESFPNEVSGIPELIGSVLRIIQPLIQAGGMQVEVDLLDNLPPVSGQLTAMRQVLLNILTASVRVVSRGRVTISAQVVPEGVWIIMEVCAPQGAKLDINPDKSENIEMAKKFIGLFDGKLQILPLDPHYTSFEMHLLLPVTEQVPVLVIDDNADILHLFQRYLSGTRFRFVERAMPPKYFYWLKIPSPKIIVLDVMMPGIEDWELLGRIRAHPRLRDIPIIVCTILPQENLARALGATGFIRKPVNRQTFLAVLDQFNSPH